MAKPARHHVRLSVRWKMTGVLSLFTVAMMTAVVVMVQREVSTTFRGEIQERGLALARNLASSSVEPMEVAEEKTLALMLLVRDYIQTGGDEGAKKRLFEHRPLISEVVDGVKSLGREQGASDVRNEGVLSVAVVDSSTNIIAWADASAAQDAWMERLGLTYTPEGDAGFLIPGQDSAIWQSKMHNGVFIIAVPIIKRAAQASMEGAIPGEPADPAAPAAAPPASIVYGTVYLEMTQNLVTRKVALAVANLIVVTFVVLLFGVLATIWMGGTLAHPIRLLERGVMAIASGDYNQKIYLRRTWRDELRELTDSFNDMAKGLAERELMRGAFSTYVSQDLLAEIIKNPEAMKVGGARRTASVMFSFFSEHGKFMAATEKMEPEFVVRLINAYLELQAKMVKEHEGYLDKFIGEEAMAVFGIPTERADHAKLAVRCAFDIKKAIDGLNSARTKQGLMINGVSIGVNSGPLVAGNLGSAGAKLDYTVIGDTVNTAARLGQNAKAGQVLISEATYELVMSEVVVNELEPIRVKGKVEPLRIFEVVEMKGPHSPVKKG